jgi:SAM-dependent methyltransferase
VPVTSKVGSGFVLLQRDQYSKGGITKIYWDYRDQEALKLLDNNDKVIVDLGCGEGLTLAKTIKMFPESHVSGLDILDENVDICLQHGLPVIKNDLYHINLPEESVDAVIFMEVIEHLETPDRAISEIYRILKPGGKLIMVFPNDFIFKVARLACFKFREAFYDPGHVKQWTPATMRKFLRSTFEVYYIRCIPLGIWLISLHCVIGARKPG